MSHAKQLHNRQYFDDSMEIINRKGLPGHINSALCQQVNDAVVATTQQVIEQALEAELTAYVGAERYERLAWGRDAEQTRSGCYRRALITQYGCIADLRVPKLRKGNGNLEWQTISRYERCWGPFLDQQVMHYCLGLSRLCTKSLSSIVITEENEACLISFSWVFPFKQFSLTHQSSN